MFLSEALLLLSAVARKLCNGILGSGPQDQRPRMFVSEAVELPTVVGATYSGGIRDSKSREHRQHMFLSEALLLRTVVPAKFYNANLRKVPFSRALTCRHESTHNAHACRPKIAQGNFRFTIPRAESRHVRMKGLKGPTAVGHKFFN